MARGKRSHRVLLPLHSLPATQVREESDKELTKLRENWSEPAVAQHKPTAATDDQPAVVTKVATNNQAAGNTTAGNQAAEGEACCSTCYRFWSCSQLPCQRREKQVLTVMEDTKAPPLPASKTVVRERAGRADKAAANTADNTTAGGREAGNQAADDTIAVSDGATDEYRCCGQGCCVM